MHCTAIRPIIIIEKIRKMKILSIPQIREADAYTIKNEPVASIDLMERAAGKLFEWYIARFERTRPVLIFTGPGNNGGDGLALARLLSKNGYNPEVSANPTMKSRRNLVQQCDPDYPSGSAREF